MSPLSLFSCNDPLTFTHITSSKSEESSLIYDLFKCHGTLIKAFEPFFFLVFLKCAVDLCSVSQPTLKTHTHTHTCKTEPSRWLVNFLIYFFGLRFVSFRLAAKTFYQAMIFPFLMVFPLKAALPIRAHHSDCNLQSFIDMLCFLRRWPRRLEMESCSLRSTREVLSGNASVIALYHHATLYFFCQLLLL